jgi:hypothetical protein
MGSDTQEGLTNMALDFTATPGLPEDPAEARNVRLPAAAPVLEPGAPTDLELMHGIQAEDPEALSQLYDRYNGILKALILRVIHNEAEADDCCRRSSWRSGTRLKISPPKKANRLAGW